MEAEEGLAPRTRPARAATRRVKGDEEPGLPGEASDWIPRVTESAVILQTCGPGVPACSESRDRNVGERGEEEDGCRCDQRTADGAASDHASGSCCRERCHQLGSRRTIPKVANFLGNDTRAHMFGPGIQGLPWWTGTGREVGQRLGRLSRLGAVRRRMIDDRFGQGSAQADLELDQVQTIMALSARRTKTQGRIGCSGTETWSNTTDSITDQDPEVERVRGATPGRKWAAREQSQVGRGGLVERGEPATARGDGAGLGHFGGRI